MCMKNVSYPGGFNWVERCPVEKIFLIFINHLTVVNVNDCTRFYSMISMAIIN